MNMMSIRINPGNLQSSEAIVAWIERRVRASLRRFAHRVTRVEVHFADLNGPKEGKTDMRCGMEARINGRKPLAVEHRADNLYAAIDGASRKLRTAVGRAVDRVATRNRRRTIVAARRATARLGRPLDSAPSLTADVTDVAAPSSVVVGAPGPSGRASAGRHGPSNSVAGHVIIAGYGPVGRALADELIERGVPITIIEANGRTVRTQGALGRSIVHGDAAEPKVLLAAGVRHAAALAITIPDGAAAQRACRAARLLASGLYIAARTRHLNQALEARQMGADAVTVEEIATAEAMAATVAGVLTSSTHRARKEAS